MSCVVYRILPFTIPRRVQFKPMILIVVLPVTVCRNLWNTKSRTLFGCLRLSRIVNRNRSPNRWHTNCPTLKNESCPICTVARNFLLNTWNAIEQLIDASVLSHAGSSSGHTVKIFSVFLQCENTGSYLHCSNNSTVVIQTLHVW